MRHSLEQLVVRHTRRLPSPTGPSGAGEVAARQFDAALMTAGFKLSAQLLEHLSGLSEGTVVDTAVRTLGTVREMVGDHVRHNVYFIDFPANVPDTFDFWTRCIADTPADKVRAVRAVPGGAGFQFFNGLPTAEMTAPAYRGIGVDLYSSAVFAFAPEIALAFHRALAEGDEALVARLLDEFYGPLVELRDEVPGYAVSLIKAGVTVRGLDVGGVRAPLVDPGPEHVARLAKLIDHGLEVIGA